MAVAPLQIPQLGAVSTLDFNGLEKLGEQIRQGRLDASRREALQRYAGGDPQALIASGDMTLANLYVQDQARRQAQANTDRAFTAGREDAAATRANAAASLDLQRQGLALRADKTPEGFQAGAEGSGLQPIPGGPKDPAYIATAQKPRQMSITDITKLSEEGGKAAELSGFSDTFKDAYAGHTITGSAANVAGRYLPEGLVGKDIAEGAGWWQGYDRYKNVVRNELFGASLTKGEQQAFLEADITPGMDPAQIKRNLAKQKAVVENGIKRKANAMIQSGYSADAIGKAYGVPVGSAAPAAGGAVDWQTYFGGPK